MIDKTFDGRYRLEEKVGVGGMAEVYRAFDTTLDRTVAVKVLHPHYAAEEDFVARFRREAQAAANLNQPNIVNVYDWGAENGTYFIVMEYLVGLNLKEVITAEGPLPPSRVVDIGRQVAAALQAAHRHEIVHRDIKPQNIIFTDEGEVKVTDFGIARSTAGNVTQTASIIGTAHYLSPEQAKSDRVGPASDIYSLGVVLYEMLTGKVPFEGDGPVAVALKHIQETPKAPSELVDDVPEELEAVIKKAMAKDPAQRYRSAAEIRDDLTRLAAGMPVRTAIVDENDQTMVIPKPVVPDQDREKPPGRGLKIAGLVFLLIALFVGSAFATNAALTRIATTELPDLTGLTAKEARGLLGDKLKLQTDEAFDPKIAKGLIILQSPNAGTKLGQGRSVTVTLSKGKERVAVPNLRNKILNQASIAISKAGLEFGSLRRDFSETIAEDYVIIQDPPAGGRVDKGTFVNIVVSKGRRPQKTPNVSGKNVEEAKIIITNDGLTAVVQESFDDDVPAGEVITQSPATGVPINKGESVTISVSKGPELFSIPNVKGDSEGDANDKLVGDGFTVEVKTSVSEPESYDLVVTQNPEAASQAEKGALVTIWIGMMPADGSGMDSD